MSRILCVDDDASVTQALERFLHSLGHETQLAPGLRAALERMERERFDLVISSFRIGDPSATRLLQAAARDAQDVPVIVMTDYERHQDAADALTHGAVDYLTKPLRQEALRLAVNNAIEIGRLRRENDDYRRRITSLEEVRAIVGESDMLRGVLDVVQAVAPTRATVLIEGEPGTGKEVFARAIHEGSPRRDRPFVTFNCAALPEGQAESALFGDEPGEPGCEGAFQRAEGGTLLLVEVSELRLDLQAKLLRALQEREIEPAGNGRPAPVDVRLVATTQRDLKAEADAGRFRRDLCYRLSVVPIRTPPLRARLDDLPLLVTHFVARAARELGIRPPAVPPETLERLRQHPWPGNIRELANAVERAVILSRTGTLPPSAFDLRVPGTASPPAVSALPVPGVPGSSPGAFPAAAPGSATFNLRALKRTAVERALAATGGRRGRAAELLGISERTLRNMLNRPAGLAKRAG